MKITVNDMATPLLESMISRVRNRRTLMRALGQGAVEAIRAHYRKQPTNKMGWPTQKFWEKEGARKTQLTAFDDASATVTVDSVAMAHKLHGGRIVAKQGKKLAIPARPEAYRLGSPGAWSIPGDGQLEPMFNRDREVIALVRGTSRTGKKARDRGVVLYWLKESVDQDEDARAFPSMQVMGDAVAETLKARLKLLLHGE